jgi:hypothetical protein
LEITVAALKDEVIALAKAEEIYKEGKNDRHWAKWGLVAIGINPQSEHAEPIRDMWKRTLAPTTDFKPQDFGPGIIDQFAILNKALPWESEGLKGIDFCLLTLTTPRGRLPTPMEIAKAIKLSSYFHRTAASGIITPDDDQIRRHLADK